MDFRILWLESSQPILLRGEVFRVVFGRELRPRRRTRKPEPKRPDSPETDEQFVMRLEREHREVAEAWARSEQRERVSRCRKYGYWPKPLFLEPDAARRVALARHALRELADVETRYYTAMGAYDGEDYRRLDPERWRRYRETGEE